MRQLGYLVNALYCCDPLRSQGAYQCLSYNERPSGGTELRSPRAISEIGLQLTGASHGQQVRAGPFGRTPNGSDLRQLGVFGHLTGVRKQTIAKGHYTEGAELIALSPAMLSTKGGTEGVRLLAGINHSVGPTLWRGAPLRRFPEFCRDIPLLSCKVREEYPDRIMETFSVVLLAEEWVRHCG